MSYVYVIEESITEEQYLSGGGWALKVGFTSDSDIRNRLSQLQTGNPNKLHVKYVFQFKDAEMARSVERLVHWKLQKSRLNGEWFEASPESEKFFIAIRFMSTDISKFVLQEFLEKNGHK